MMRLSDSALDRLRAALTRPAVPERYDLAEIIGYGGMGVVWRARDVVLDRDVAVKVIAPHLVDPAFSSRLQREARILARLAHPGIVPVHDLGFLEDGSPWYVMRLVRGTRLDVAAQLVPSRRELVRIVERLCETVAYAHAHQIVHRDLKPSNVMLGPFGDVLVLDWGVARTGGEADSESREVLEVTRQSPAGGETLTQAESVLGTPGYMAPEQAAGGAADERADVYGLGAILRDMCQVHPDSVPRRLAAVRDRAMETNPANRYQSALELRDDLRRLLDGARVHAHKESLVESLRRIGAAYRVPIQLVIAYLAMRLAFLLWGGL
jgi:serine/threonine protein kinase